MPSTQFVDTLRRGALFVAVLASLYVVWSLQPATAIAGLLLSVWLILPYAALALLTEGRLNRATTVADSIASVVVAAGGLLFLTLVVFANPDPQSAIAVMLTPIYQSIAIGVLLPITRQLVRQRESAPK
jgi:hypothetical protein